MAGPEKLLLIAAATAPALIAIPYAVDAVIVAGLSCFAAALVLRSLRERPQRLLAGFILGALAGYTAQQGGLDGITATIITLIGCVAGPNIVIFLEGQAVADRIGEAILSRLGGEAKPKPKPPEQDQ